MMHRRDVLRLGLAGGTAALSMLGRPPTLGAAAQAASAPPPVNPAFPQVPSWSTELRELAPGVYAYIQGGGPGKDNVSVSNAGLIVGDDGVMVIDTLTAPMHAARFIEAIRRVTDKPVRHVVNTHHHARSRERQSVLHAGRDHRAPVLS